MADNSSCCALVLPARAGRPRLADSARRRPQSVAVWQETPGWGLGDGAAAKWSTWTRYVTTHHHSQAIKPMQIQPKHEQSVDSPSRKVTS